MHQLIKGNLYMIAEAWQDDETKEFHITPVLTYSWYKSQTLHGGALAFEWGKWAVMIGFARRFDEITS